jgi:hypothetical protein
VSCSIVRGLGDVLRGGRGAVYIDPAAAHAWLRRLGDEVVRDGGLLVIIEGDSETNMDGEVVLIPVGASTSGSAACSWRPSGVPTKLGLL